MERELFTSSTVESVRALLAGIGVLGALTGALFAVAFGIAYVSLRASLVDGQAIGIRRLSLIGARLLLGSVFLVVGGLNGLLQFVPDHPSSLREPCEACQRFLEGLAASGYLFVFVKTTELVAGLLVILELWVPLMLVVLGPIVLNIILYHVFLNPIGREIAVALVLLTLYLAHGHREAYAPLFRPCWRPWRGGLAVSLGGIGGAARGFWGQSQSTGGDLTWSDRSSVRRRWQAS